ncbi:DUF1549 and DUF1553 domain-containing protein [Roseimaritima multifibrata]|nr:DUF1549 and DUF1553 domain-containing protein [Roseimaritima multifibrata]
MLQNPSAPRRSILAMVVCIGLLAMSCNAVAEEPEAAPSDRLWSFRNDVQSILSRHGCNAGACHGTLAGKGGFRLSLHGFDSEADYLAITKQNRGRRIEIADPGRSLLLAKPTGTLPHKGGIRLETDSRDYQILAEWIAAGAPGPAQEDARLTNIKVAPEKARLATGDTAQLTVHAQYDDGGSVDVTSWAKFSATDESIAGVDENGLVTIRGSGEGAIRVWFGSRIALARMTVSFPHPTSPSLFAKAPRENFIDELVLEQLQTLNLPPSPRCDDETFLRRAFLDTVGRLPNEQQRQIYLSTPAPERRSQLIQRLLSSEDYVDYWTYKWSDMLLINGNRLRPQAVQAYYKWIRGAVAEDRPWDKIVRQILTATGVSTENGATNFYALHQTPEEMTENACQAFMGLSIGCAKCHNHPLEKWSNDQYYGMANLFARVRAKGWGGETRNGDGIRTLYVTDSGDVIQPTRGKPQPPTPLDSQPLEFDAPGDRRVALADWMTTADNPYFARAITNRVWANFFGRGLVEPVDDLRVSNPASNEPLLQASADYLAEAQFDLKSLMRVILESETYQRSSIPLPTNKDDDRYLSRYYPRRLMAEVLLDAVDQVLQTTTTFDQVAFSGADVQKTDFYPAGTRAIELYDSAVSSYFLKTFGRNPREIVCECERSAEPSLVQVLHLSNGDTLNPKLNAVDNLLVQLDQQGADTNQVLTALFERALSRMPTEQERQTLQQITQEYEDQNLVAWRDLAWSVLTSAEFTFNH